MNTRPLARLYFRNAPWHDMFSWSLTSERASCSHHLAQHIDTHRVTNSTSVYTLIGHLVELFSWTLVHFTRVRGGTEGAADIFLELSSIVTTLIQSNIEDRAWVNWRRITVVFLFFSQQINKPKVFFYVPHCGETGFWMRIAHLGNLTPSWHLTVPAGSMPYGAHAQMVICLPSGMN